KEHIPTEVAGVLLDFLIRFKPEAREIYIPLAGDYTQRKFHPHILPLEKELREVDRRKILALGNGDLVIGNKNVLVYQKNGVIYFQEVKSELPALLLEKLMISGRSVYFYSNLNYNFAIPRSHKFFGIFEDLIVSKPDEFTFYSYFSDVYIEHGHNGITGPAQ